MFRTDHLNNKGKSAKILKVYFEKNEIKKNLPEQQYFF